MTHSRYVLALILFLTISSAAAAQRPTFRIAAEEVSIDILVTHRGTVVEDLRAEDFEILDNGIRQTVQYATLQKNLPIDAMLVFDMSRSLDSLTLKELKEAAKMFLDNLTKDDRAGLLTFNHAVTQGSQPTNDFGRIMQALNQIHPSGHSSLIDASYAALAVSGSSSGPTLIIIFSDGMDTYSWLSGAEVVESARRKNASVYAITTVSPPSSGRRKQKSFLEDLAGATGGNLFYTGASRDLSGIFLEILNDFRRHYLVTYTPQGVASDGWHSLKVRVKNRAYQVKTRPGYVRNPLQSHR